MPTVEQWDQWYQAGRWDLLHDLSEVPRYGVIAAYLGRAAPGGRVLDAGCGEAILARYLSAEVVREYVGVDCSHAALARARRDGRMPMRLICADIEAFTPAPGELFEAIVFNEVAYYLTDPLAAFERWAAHLAPGGILIVSMYAHNRRGEEGKAALVSTLWRTLARAPAWRAEDDTVVRSVTRDIRWRIQLLRRQHSKPESTRG